MTDMRMLSKTPQKKKRKVKWSQACFLCKFCCALSICCFSSHSLSLSLPKSARHKTRYSASSPYFGILHCTAPVSNPFASFKIHGKAPLDIFSSFAIGITKTFPILSQQCEMNILFHIDNSLTLTSFQTSMTDLLSFTDHRRWYFDFKMSFFQRTHTMSRGFQAPKRTKRHSKSMQCVSYTLYMTHIC